MGLAYAGRRTRDILRQQNGRAETSSRVHTNAMNVLDGHHMLLAKYSPNFRMNYCTIVNVVLVELWEKFQRSNGVMIIQLR